MSDNQISAENTYAEATKILMSAYKPVTTDCWWARHEECIDTLTPPTPEQIRELLDCRCKCHEESELTPIRLRDDEEKAPHD